MAIAVEGLRAGAGRGPDFLSSITSNGLFVPLAALGVEIGMFLPLAMAMLSGDAIAGEANIGTLRYLLTVPVHRTRLLAVKYASLCIGALMAVTAVALPGAAIGIALFGTGDMTTLSGSQLGFSAAVWRVLLVMLYLATGLAGLASVGLFISTLTEQPIAASIALLIFTILSWILDAVPSSAGCTRGSSSTSGWPSVTCCATRSPGRTCCAASSSTARMPPCSGSRRGRGSRARTSRADRAQSLPAAPLGSLPAAPLGEVTGDTRPGHSHHYRAVTRVPA